VPELAQLDNHHIHAPWLMTPLEASLAEFELGRDYPAPVVDLETHAKLGRDLLWGHRKEPAVRSEQQRILATHTRRKKPNDDDNAAEPMLF
jgi:deoxyribodipyrimidine photo-lyase